jgi:tRNA pseudouridine(55) synthase
MSVIEYKPFGVSSYVHSEIVKKKYGVKKIAYTGRLDLMAKGLVKYLLDEECKNHMKYYDSIKTYEFYLVLGIRTDSLDCLGFIQEMINKKFSSKDIEKVIKSFVKKYNQDFPVFSTKTVDYEGKKHMLIKLYRNHGYIPETLPKKEVNIYEIDFLSNVEEKQILKDFIDSVERFQDPYDMWRKKDVLESLKKEDLNKTFQIIKLRARVSTGTYIRQLCHDIAKTLGTCACAYEITRTNIEEKTIYRLKSVHYDNLTYFDKDNIKNDIYNIDNDQSIYHFNKDHIQKVLDYYVTGNMEFITRDNFKDVFEIFFHYGSDIGLLLCYYNGNFKKELDKLKYIDYNNKNYDELEKDCGKVVKFNKDFYNYENRVKYDKYFDWCIEEMNFNLDILDYNKYGTYIELFLDR